MNVLSIKEKLGLSAFVTGNDRAEVLSCYSGDVLSAVMSHAKRGALWLTVLTDMSVAVTAKLTDVAAVLLCEGVKPDEHLLAKAKQQGVTLLGTDSAVFETAAALSKWL